MNFSPVVWLPFSSYTTLDFQTYFFVLFENFYTNDEKVFELRGITLPEIIFSKFPILINYGSNNQLSTSRT